MKLNLSSSSQQQRKRLLEALKIKPITTIEAREELDIFHPAARVQELRAQGYKIATHRETIETSKGIHDRVGRYVLLNGGRDE